MDRQTQQLSFFAAPEPYDRPTLKQIPLCERPLQRLYRVGTGAVSTTELIAILVAGERQLEIAGRLLARYGSVAGLARTSLAELSAERGLGPVKAAQLQAALELGRRMLTAAPEDRQQIRSPADVAYLLMAELGHLEQEHFHVLFLDTRNRILGRETVYKGSLNQSQIRVGEVFREAVRRNCAAIIASHNHPSGDPAPSPEDVAVTRELVAAGKLLGIELLDHLVIGQSRWISLRERGLGFEGGVAEAAEGYHAGPQRLHDGEDAGRDIPLQTGPLYRCWTCGAPAAGLWSWQEAMGGPTVLDAWGDHIAYLKLPARCREAGHPARVIRLGAAITPPSRWPEGTGWEAVEGRIAAIREALDRLARAVGPQGAPEDPVAGVVYRLLAGVLAPQAAIAEIRALVGGASISLPLLLPAEVSR